MNKVWLLAALNLSCMSAGAQELPGTVRARVIELVDDGGRVRGQLEVEEGGEVVFRLRDPSGEVRVKLAAGADGAGLLLANDATEVGFHALAKASGTTLTLKNKDGAERVITPATP